MNNLIIFTLMSVIGIFVIIPMFAALFAVKFVRVTYYTIKHNILGFEIAHPPIAQ